MNINITTFYAKAQPATGFIHHVPSNDSRGLVQIATTHDQTIGNFNACAGSCISGRLSNVDFNKGVTHHSTGRRVNPPPGEYRKQARRRLR